jgi:hypothetical protein
VTSTITIPFSFDGAGDYCWQTSTLGTYANSWNVTKLTINGVPFIDIYVAAGSFPPAINGYWYIGYTSAASFGHFEMK